METTFNNKINSLVTDNVIEVWNNGNYEDYSLAFELIINDCIDEVVDEFAEEFQNREDLLDNENWNEIRAGFDVMINKIVDKDKVYNAFVQYVQDENYSEDKWED